jgi:hypothetical protein
LSFKRIVEGFQGDPYYLLGISKTSRPRTGIESSAPVGPASAIQRCDETGLLLGSLAKAERKRLESLRNGLRGEPLSIWLTCMVGDAMADVIKEDEVIGIDPTVHTIKGNGIYAFEKNGRMFVRRAEERLGQGIALLCENKKYENVMIKTPDDEAFQGLSVLGRVLFVIKHI